MRINEHFLGLEGEGQRQGYPTYFIRAQGCSIRCPFCDSKSTWNHEGGYYIKNRELLGHIVSSTKEYNFDWVSITGGNPMENEEIVEFMDLIHSSIGFSFKFHLEHPGSFLDYERESNIINNYFHTVCFDLKPFYGFSDLIKTLEKIDNINVWWKQIKCIITSEEDLDFYSKLLSQKEFTSRNTTIVVSPCFDDNNEIIVAKDTIDKTVDYILRGELGIGVKMSVQLHKIINQR